MSRRPAQSIGLALLVGRCFLEAPGSRLISDGATWREAGINDNAPYDVKFTGGKHISFDTDVVTATCQSTTLSCN